MGKKMVEIHYNHTIEELKANAAMFWPEEPSTTEAEDEFKEETPLGKAPYRETERIDDLTELLRIATEFGLPVKAPNGKFFPPGKKAADYAYLN